MYVIGTAGHVDHGKSTLVKALTGIDPDRLKEEKAREMTIDLGFAWLTLPSGREVSVVDVPGHERFIKNMLAGVGGIDLALLVVAADEGVMPQTREHLAILDLLHLTRGVVAVTKRDLVDDEWLELVPADIQGALKGTSLHDAPLVAVSAQTGQGLDTLKATIDTLLERTPAKRNVGRPRLPIDRAFSMTGFGTVVTGTLIDGALEAGQELQIAPKDLKARVRGLQSHRKKMDVAEPGRRVAVNLTGVEPGQIARGDVLTTPGWLKPTIAVDARLRLVKDTPPLKHNAPITFHTGSAERAGIVRLLEADEMAPGSEGWVQLRLNEPVAVVKGDSFIIRWSGYTVGGGEVIEPQAKRHKRHDEAMLQHLEVMQAGSPEEVFLEALVQREPAELKAVASKANIPMEQALASAKALAANGRVIALGGAVTDSGALLLSSGWWSNVKLKAQRALELYHRQFQVRAGAPKEELRNRLGLTPPVFPKVLARLVKEGVVVEQGAVVRLQSHSVQLTPSQQQQVNGYLKALASTPYTPPSDAPVDVELLGLLIELGKVVRCAPDVVYTREAYEEMVKRIVEQIKAKGKITVAEVRDLFGASRKYALPLLEYLDQQKVTRRVGDERVLR